jgi:branched-chain amino acid aminotransferase
MRADPDSWAYFRGRFVRMAEANISIATHALHYGTGVFEGIRAYETPDHGELYLLKLPEHFRRMVLSCRIARIDPGHTVEEMCEITRELVRRNGFREDIYIRPIAFKATPTIGLRLRGLEDAFAVFCLPLKEYIDSSGGLHCCVSSWVRPDDNALPVRAKITGAYINACLASDDARANGFDEAILLTADGHVSEAASANLFMVRDGELITSLRSDAILEGITRGAVIELAREMGIPVVERTIDRTELYVADELFFTGTALQIAPIVRVDHRPVGEGVPGPITLRLQEAYARIVRGEDPRHADWLSPVYGSTRARLTSPA